MRFFGQVARTTCVTGFMGGTLYLVVIAALTFFGGVLSGAIPTVLWLALLVGSGAALGLIFGLVCAVTFTIAVRWVREPVDVASRWRPRLAGGLACGLPVLALTLFEQVTQTLGVLTPDLTTVVVIPTTVAAIGGAAMAPRFVDLKQTADQPKRPEM